MELLTLLSISCLELEPKVVSELKVDLEANKVV